MIRGLPDVNPIGVEPPPVSAPFGTTVLTRATLMYEIPERRAKPVANR